MSHHVQYELITPLDELCRRTRKGFVLGTPWRARPECLLACSLSLPTSLRVHFL